MSRTDDLREHARQHFAAPSPESERRVLGRGWAVQANSDAWEGKGWDGYDTRLFANEAEAWDDWIGDFRFAHGKSWEERVAEAKAKGARAVYVELVEVAPPGGKEESRG